MSARQLALLDHGAALDGEVLPPEAPPQPDRFAPSEAEMQELAGEVKAAYAEFQASMCTTADKAVALGAVLNKVKERIGHGWWLSWLERHTKIKPGMATQYMLWARAKEELPARDFQRIKKLGVAAGAAELRRRRREERQSKREEAPARLPAPRPERDREPMVEPNDPPTVTKLAEIGKAARPGRKVKAGDGPPTKRAAKRKQAPKKEKPVQVPARPDHLSQLYLWIRSGGHLAHKFSSAAEAVPLAAQHNVHLNDLGRSLDAATEFLVGLREAHKSPNPMAEPGDLSVQPHDAMLREFLVFCACYQHEHPEANDEEIAFALNTAAGLVRGGLLGRARKDAGLAKGSGQ